MAFSPNGGGREIMNQAILGFQLFEANLAQRGEDWKLESVLSLGSARVHDMPSHRKLLLLIIPISDAPECLGSFSALCGFVYHTVKVCFSAGFLRVIRFPLFGVCTGFE